MIRVARRGRPSGLELSEDIRKSTWEIVVGNAHFADSDNTRIKQCFGGIFIKMLHDRRSDEFQKRETSCEGHLKDVIRTIAQEIMTRDEYRREEIFARRVK